jgi:hypothetical protein
MRSQLEYRSLDSSAHTTPREGAELYTIGERPDRRRTARAAEKSR